MELRVLRYFLAVAEEGNITWAAQLLRISQPTLSRQLKQLEEELGVTLFERGSHTITLTEEGRLLRKRAQTIVSLADKTEFELRQSGGELSGEIAVGCGELRGMSTLSQRMAAFREPHPGVRFRVTSTTSDIIQDQLEQGLMDFGLLADPVDVSQYEYRCTDSTEPWAAMVPENHPLAMRASLTPQVLKDFPLLFPVRTPVHNLLLNWFGRYADQARANIAGYCSLTNNALIMVSNGLGIFLGIDLGIAYPGTRSVPLSPALETGSSIVWKKQAATSPAAAEFARFLSR
ncbi:MAG: LysR family transcriptional regulator [Bifidobacterium scardovii]|uniref:LysR family transcriptional regulator n=1 Tax=Bifidobacterium scardovii TaxID=158787 RepID=UPI002902AE51|nr:LysR family transcriptional regulator [Bifidobacterium scardovii]MDU2422691.1 LysR family transcriptional regulator [Bifidobacterium scardovii]